MILSASGDAVSASNTSRFVRPFLLWLKPGIKEETILMANKAMRKIGHFTVYAGLALLAARIFITSSKSYLNKYWFASAAVLAAIVAVTDEFQQSFYLSRTGTFYDCLLDIAGALTALSVVAFLIAATRRRTHQRTTATLKQTNIKATS